MPWDLQIDRSDIALATLRDTEVPEPEDGQAVLRVDRVSVTTNNVTYALFGESMRYWDFFPTGDPATGRVPLWGFATIVASRSDVVPEGTRVYGYLPSASHAVVTPGPGPAFRDRSPHRSELAGVYNSYLPRVVVDEHEGDLQLLYRPLFGTAFLLADQLAEVEGAEQVVLSSASSKTAYGTAHLLHGVRRVVGLTSAGNADFVRSLGCYDDVLTYDEVGALPARQTAYADMSGSSGVRAAVHERLGDALLQSAVVGATHADASSTGRLPGPKPAFFFAPDRISVRNRDWGHDGFRQRFDAAWTSFVPVVDGWVDVRVSEGPASLAELWPQLVAGDVRPRDGHVVDVGRDD